MFVFFFITVNKFGKSYEGFGKTESCDTKPRFMTLIKLWIILEAYQRSLRRIEKSIITEKTSSILLSRISRTSLVEQVRSFNRPGRSHSLINLFSSVLRPDLSFVNWSQVSLKFLSKRI